MTDRLPRARLRRLHVQNFRSIEALTLELEPVTLLVGPNGAGKSNLIDATAFLAEAATAGLRAAIVNRDGIDAVRRHAPGGRGRPRDVRLELELETLSQTHPIQRAAYGLLLGAREGGEWYVKEEWLAAWPRSRRAGPRLVFHRSENTVVTGHAETLFDDQLALPGLSDPAAELVARLLGRIARFDIHVEALRRPQPFESPNALLSSGENLSHVWATLERSHPETAARIVALLRQVVPDLVAVRSRPAGRYGILEADFAAGATEKPVTVDGAGLSDGTLRALAQLVAVYQPNPATLVALEEPEIALHPFAAGRLFNALLSAPDRPQLLVSTHSPAILDSGSVEPSMLRVVAWRDGATVAGPIDSDQVDEIRKHLTSSAELLSMNQLHARVSSTKPRSLRPSEAKR